MLRRSLCATVVVLIFAALVAHVGTVRAQARGCPGRDAVPADDESRGEATRAVLCLVNRLRSARDMRAVRFSRPLSAAARGHALDMVGNDFFGHEGSGGDDLAARLRAAGYGTSHPGGYEASETLAWGTQATPRMLVQALLQSPAHRAIVLDPRQRTIGLGLVLGAPAAGAPSPSATLVLDFAA